MLEVIAKDIKDIEKINESVAQRIELVTGVEHGCLTPNIEVCKKAGEISKNPIVVMVRNHWDNFFITDTQLEEVLNQIKALRETKVQGIVWGAITPDNKIDVEALKQVVSEAGHLEVIFHKAFDILDDKIEGLQILKDYGVKRVLTAGGEGLPTDNAETLRKMQAIGGVEILIGGGVTLDSIPEIKKLGFNDFHVGSKLRVEGSYEKEINLSLVKTFRELIE